jgi:hypothetical protein
MATVQKIDLYRLHAADYVKPKHPVLVVTKTGRYLAVDGSGDPSGSGFTEAVGALYAMAYTIKMAKKRLGLDFKVAGLEGLWWGAGADTSKWMVDQSKATWRWKLLIRMPDFIKERCLVMAAEILREKGKGKAVAAVKLERIAEGKCVQMLHVGPYRAEGPTMDAMLAFAKEQGLRFTGRHHEIYLSDPNRSSPDKMKTIIRQPVKKE